MALVSNRSAVAQVVAQAIRDEEIAERTTSILETAAHRYTLGVLRRIYLELTGAQPTSAEIERAAT